MRPLRSLLASVFAPAVFAPTLVATTLIATTLLAAPAVAQEDSLPHQKWSFQSLFGTFDLAAAQRGFQVYANVCANCHSAKYLHYRDLAGIGLDADQIKGIAAAVRVTATSGSPLDDSAHSRAARTLSIRWRCASNHSAAGCSLHRRRASIMTSR